MRDFISAELVRKHGTPDNFEKLEEYLDLVLNYDKDVNETYSETHHILTRSQFPEYYDQDWNLVKLRYEDHVKAHELLYESFNLRTYHYCLTFMKVDNKDREKVSNAAKKGWISLKNDAEKYKQWHLKRQEYLENMPVAHREKIGKAGKNVWQNYSEEEYNKRCETNKNIWTEEVRKKKSIAQIKYAEDNREKLKESTRSRWNKMTYEERLNFSEKMNAVNKDPEKRKKAGESIKKKWEQEEFRDRMKTRRSPGYNYKCIYPSGEVEIFSSLNDAKTQGLNLTLIRRYVDTDIPVPLPKKQSTSKMNQRTVGCKFYRLKNSHNETN